MAMGAADVVPGVSGGTIAFISGIYERLLNAIKSVDFGALKVLQKDGLKAAWNHVDATFLVALFGGILVSILSLAKALEWCMHSYPQLLWSFFFGLIIASAIYIAKQVSQWDISTIGALILGFGIAFSITFISPAEASDGYLMAFIAGAIAICAMILPGISGSFILLLMGMYAHVLGALNDRNLVYIGIFMLGCVVGLMFFSRVLSWTFKHYKNVTLALLTGFMIGALNKVWPWQNVIKTRINSDGEEEPFLLQSVMPNAYTEGETMLIPAIVLMILGFGIVFLLEKLSPEQTVSE